MQEPTGDEILGDSATMKEVSATHVEAWFVTIERIERERTVSG
jgi:hypothetical protein